MSMLMSMGGDASVEPWFADLPLSDPRCNNDSCTAYHQAHTASQAQISFESQFRYGWWLAWAYSIVIVLFVLAHAANSLMPRHFDASMRTSAWDKVIAMARKATYRRIPGRAAQFFALPSFGVLALMIFMFAGLTIMAFVQHPYYRGKRGYGSPPLGVRTGLMAFALIPLELALAGKVNPVTCLTGIGHEKLNVIHRWTGWAVLFLSVVHTVPFIVQPLREGGPSALHKQYYKAGGMEFTGTPPLGMLVGLVLLSLPPLRRLAYELFVQVHLALAVAFLGLCFWHAAKSLDSWNYLWATVGIWLFSLMVRMTRKTSLFSIRGPFSQSQAVMTKLPHNMVCLDVSVKGTWKWEPGQHFFLRFLGLRPLDNHPFTVCNLPKHKDGRTVMTFLVRPHDGVTKRIGAVAERKTSIGVCVDGPYGTVIRPRIETRYQQAILVAGGGGISGVLPWLEHLASQIGKEGSSLKSVHLVWAVRTANCLSWAAEDVRAVQEQSSPGTVTYDVWVTDQNDASGETTETTDDKEAQVVNRGQEDTLVHVSHFGQRPALAEVMPAVVGAGRSIVLGCGPESLKVDLSNVVASMQGEVIKGRKQEVRLHTETFGW